MENSALCWSSDTSIVPPNWKYRKRNINIYMNNLKVCNECQNLEHPFIVTADCTPFTEIGGCIELHFTYSMQ